MKLYKTTAGIVVVRDDGHFLLKDENIDSLINDDNLGARLSGVIEGQKPQTGLLDNGVLPPVGRQEIWAAGVTYYRSKVGRQEESKAAGGGDFYARVYEAPRPELFFKSPAYRAVGNGDKVRIRKDSTWDVPEPELTLVISASGKIVGYTIGNDMSSRSIEGENPLYLPQAKCYDRSASVGPCIFCHGETLAARHIDFAGDHTRSEGLRGPHQYQPDQTIVSGTGVLSLYGDEFPLWLPADDRYRCCASK